MAELPASLSGSQRLQSVSVSCAYVQVSVAPGALGGPAMQACRFRRVRPPLHNTGLISAQWSLRRQLVNCRCALSCQYLQHLHDMVLETQLTISARPCIFSSMIVTPRCRADLWRCSNSGRTNLSQVTLTAEHIESASLQSLLLEGCSGTVTFGALPALQKLELTSRHLPMPDSIADLRALQKLVRPGYLAAWSCSCSGGRY